MPELWTLARVKTVLLDFDTYNGLEWSGYAIEVNAAFTKPTMISSCLYWDFALTRTRANSQRNAENSGAEGCSAQSHASRENLRQPPAFSAFL